MDAVTLLQKNIQPEQLLHHYKFHNVHHNGNMIRSCCKIHDGNNPTGFVMDTETGLWYCWTGGCGGGDMITLVQKMENIGFKSAVQFLADLFKINLANATISERKANHIKELQTWIKAIRSRSIEEHVEYHVNVPVKEVIKFRDFQEETLRHFNLGHVNKIQLQKRNGEHYTLRNRLLIPIIQDGKQVGVSLRRVKNTDIPKWSHQPLHIHTRNMLYNFDEVKTCNKIVIVEGMFDVWAYHELGISACATFGAHITEQQYRMLMRTGADLVFSYDGDEKGKEATQKAIKLFKNKANMEYVPFNAGEDPANITREVLYERFKSKRRV